MSEPTPRCRAVVAGLTLFACTVAIAARAPAQLPDEFENLQVLPEDIAQRELVGVMRDFALGLGVRCQYCHVGEEGQPFSEWDFASDDKPEKRKARFMLRMVRHLNDERLPGLPEAAEAQRRSPPVTVSCETCHRGVAVPRMLEEVLALTVEREGVEAALAEYRELRARYHGTGAYDFSERRLVELGNRLRAQERPADAVEVLRLNLEFHPESATTYVALYESHEAQGHREEAIAALERAAALMPDNPNIARRLEQLRGGG